VTLAPVSEPATALTDATVAVSGSVYREAAGTIAPIAITVHVGDPGTAALTVANTDPADGFSESLIAAVTGASGGLSVLSANPTPDIAAGATDTSLMLGFSTAAAGTLSGTATLALTSDGGTGAGSLDGLGQVALAPVIVPISITVVNPATAALSITGARAGQATSDAQPIAPFSSVVITDPNAAQSETVRVVPSAAVDGVLSDPNQASDGSTIDAAGTYTVSGSAAQVTSDLNTLIFTPTAHQVAPGQTVTTGFAVTVADSAGLSAADSTSSVVATALNTPPTIGGTVAGQKIDDSETINPFAAVTVTDPDVGQTETVTVNLSSPSDGSLFDPTSAVDGSSFSLATGAFFVTGTAQTVSADLRSLVFTPALVPAGHTETTGFALSVSDGIATANDTTTSVVANSGFGFFWAQPVDGLFSQAGEWLLGSRPTQNVPGSSDTASFATGSATPYAVAGPGTAGEVLVIGDQVTLTGSLALAGLVDDVAGTIADLSISGGGALTLAAAGTINGSDAAVIGSGSLVVNGDFQGGSVQIGAGGAVTALGGMLSAGAGVTIAAGGTLSLDPTAQLLGALTLNGGTLAAIGTQTVLVSDAIALADDTTGTLAVAPGGTLALAGTIGGSGGLIFQGGTVVMEDAGDSFTGGITVEGGTLVQAAAGSAGSGVVSTAAGTANSLILAGSEVVQSGGSDTIAAGSGATTITALGNAADFVTGNAGTLLYWGADGASTVIGGSGVATLAGGTGGGLLVGGTSGGNLLAAGSGTTTLLGGGSGDTLFGGGGNSLLVAAAGNTTLVGGSGATTVVGANGGSDTLFGGTGSSILVAGASGMNVMVGGAQSVLYGGGGPDQMFAGDGTALILAGSGANQVLAGGAGSATLIGGAAGATFIGGIGQSIAVGGRGNDVFYTGAGQMTAFQGSGSDIVLGQSGSSTVVGGSGPDIYAFVNGVAGGSEIVSGFKVGLDRISLFGYGTDPIQQSTAGGAFNILLGDGTHITLLGVSALAAGSIQSA
jgi:hypothetical protein